MATVVVEGEATGFFSSSSESLDGSDGCDVEDRPNLENNIPPSPFPMLAAPACHKTGQSLCDSSLSPLGSTAVITAGWQRDSALLSFPRVRTWEIFQCLL